MSQDVSIQTLLGLPQDQFLNEYWTRQRYIAHLPPERLCGIFDAPELRSIESLVATPNELLRVDVRTLEGAPAITMPTPADAIKLYLAGNVVHISRVDAVGFRPWVSTLTRELTVPPGLLKFNVFASRRGFGVIPHFDAQDNFIVHLRGEKRWRIAPNTTVPDPVTNGTVDVAGVNESLSPNYLNAAQAQAHYGVTNWPKDMPANCEVVDMKPGSVMYLPRGYWHAVETTASESLHITIVCAIPTRVDVVRKLLAGLLPDMLERDPYWRERLTKSWSEHGPDEQVIRETLQRLLVELPKLSDVNINREAIARAYSKISLRPKYL